MSMSEIIELFKAYKYTTCEFRNLIHVYMSCKAVNGCINQKTALAMESQSWTQEIIPVFNTSRRHLTVKNINK
jgi:hypothetical protein